MFKPVEGTVPKYRVSNITGKRLMSKRQLDQKIRQCLYNLEQLVKMVQDEHKVFLNAVTVAKLNEVYRMVKQ